MNAMRSYIFSLGALLLLPSLAHALTNPTLPSPSILPDNGGTVVTLPTSADIVDISNENGSYANQFVGVNQIFHIETGLPVGTEIEINGRLRDFICESPGVPGTFCDAPGGALGGQTQFRDATITMEMEGTGTLGGFSRLISVPVALLAENGPRVPGSAVQDFDNEMVQLQGAIFGDPDFDILAIRAGRNFGLPSPGHTTLTRLGPPGSDFQVDSFFDIFYEIDFQGAPGSILEGFAGTTQDIARIYTSRIPEPSMCAMMGGGFLLAAACRRKQGKVA